MPNDDDPYPGPVDLETVRTASGFCHKVGPFPGRREDHPPRHACLYADYPSESNPADQELLANARLIAAAPDLLAQAEKHLAWLSKLTDWAGADDPDLDGLRAAIAKARGAQ